MYGKEELESMGIGAEEIQSLESAGAIADTGAEAPSVSESYGEPSAIGSVATEASQTSMQTYNVPSELAGAIKDRDAVVLEFPSRMNSIYDARNKGYSDKEIRDFFRHEEANAKLYYTQEEIDKAYGRNDDTKAWQQRVWDDEQVFSLSRLTGKTLEDISERKQIADGTGLSLNLLLDDEIYKTVKENVRIADNAAQAIVDNYNKIRAQQEYGKALYESMTKDTLTPEEEQKLEALKSEAAKYSKVISTTTAGKYLGSFTDLATQSLYGAAEGIKYLPAAIALFGGVAAFGAGAMLSAVPMGLSSILAGGTAGIGASMLAGTFENSFRQEAGFMFDEMVNQGIERSVARKYAVAGGLLNAAIEVNVLDKVIERSGLPRFMKKIFSGKEGVNNLKNLLAKDSSLMNRFVSAAWKRMKNVVADTISETYGEESMQELVSLVHEYAAKQESGIDEKFDAAGTVKQAFDAGTEAWKEMFPGLATMGAFGLAADAGGMYFRQKAYDTFNKRFPSYTANMEFLRDNAERFRQGFSEKSEKISGLSEDLAKKNKEYADLEEKKQLKATEGKDAAEIEKQQEQIKQEADAIRAEIEDTLSGKSPQKEMTEEEKVAKSEKDFLEGADDTFSATGGDVIFIPKGDIERFTEALPEGMREWATGVLGIEDQNYIQKSGEYAIPAYRMKALETLVSENGETNEQASAALEGLKSGTRFGVLTESANQEMERLRKEKFTGLDLFDDDETEMGNDARQVVGETYQAFRGAGYTQESAQFLSQIYTRYWYTKAKRKGDGSLASDSFRQFEIRRVKEDEAGNIVRDTAPGGLYTGRSNVAAGTKLGAMTFDNGKTILQLFRAANASTALHEMAHLALRDMVEIGLSEGASPEFRGDIEKAMKYLEIDRDLMSRLASGQASKEDFDRYIAAHERFAESFEVYMRTGKAPTMALMRAFRWAKGWLLKIYNSVAVDILGDKVFPHIPTEEEGNPVLSEEALQVFDNLLSTPDERGEVPEAPVTTKASDAVANIEGLHDRLSTAYRQESDADTLDRSALWEESKAEKEAVKKMAEGFAPGQSDVMKRRSFWQIAGERGIENLGDAEKRDNLEKAKRLSELGMYTDDEIFLATGWQRGLDGKWRTEIPDIKIRPSVTFTAQEGIYGFDIRKLIDADSVFMAYPELENVKVVFNPLISRDSYGGFHRERGQLYLNPYEFLKEQDKVEKLNALFREFLSIIESSQEASDNYDKAGAERASAATEEERSRVRSKWESDAKLKRIFEIEDEIKNLGALTIDQGKARDALMDTLPHEIQHAIQAYEGFSLGVSSDAETLARETKRQGDAFKRKIISELDKNVTDTVSNTSVKEAVKKIMSSYGAHYGKNDGALVRTWRDAAYKAGLSDDFINAVEGSLSMYLKLKDVKKRLGSWEGADSGKPYSYPFRAYSSFSGEVEARNVAARLSMDDQGKARTPLSETEDTPAQDQLVLFGEGKTTLIPAQIPGINAAPSSPDSVLSPLKFNFYNVQNVPEWETKVAKYMDAAGFSREEIRRNIEAIGRSKELYSAIEAKDLMMLPKTSDEEKRKGVERGGNYHNNYSDGPIRPNQDKKYLVSLDASTMCIKRALTAPVIASIERKLKNILDDGQRLALLAMFNMTGLPAPCIYCYVESPRRAANELANRAVSELAGESAMKEDKSWTPEKRAAQIELFNKAKEEMKEFGLVKDDLLRIAYGFLEGRLPDYIIKESSAKSGVQNYYVKENGEKVHAHNVIKKIQNLIDGARRKKEMVYQEYSGQILDMPRGMVEELNQSAGLRMFSWSDFQPEHVFDIIQAFHDMSVKGLKSHAYTKVPEYVRIFGRTGQKIQVSVFAKELEDGNIVEDAWQGNAWANAINAMKDNSDVGPVIVASSDRVVKWALDSPWLNYIIPFHRSGLDTKTYQILNWQDFTTQQEEQLVYKNREKLEKMIYGDNATNTTVTQGETGSAAGLGGSIVFNEDGTIAKGFDDTLGTRNYLIACAKGRICPVFPTFMFRDAKTYSESAVRAELIAAGDSSPTAEKINKKVNALRSSEAKRAREKWREIVEEAWHVEDGKAGAFDPSVIDKYLYAPDSEAKAIHHNFYRLKKDYSRTDTEFRVAQPIFNMTAAREQLEKGVQKMKELDAGLREHAKEVDAIEAKMLSLIPSVPGKELGYAAMKLVKAGAKFDTNTGEFVDKNGSVIRNPFEMGGIPEPTKPRAATLFSGAGTIDYALKNLVKSEFAVENDARIAAVYRDNHDNPVYVEDVRTFDMTKHVGNVDYLHASPPCVNFSKAKKTDIMGEKPLDRELAKATADSIRKLKPRVFTLEEVAGYAGKKNAAPSESLQMIIDTLKEEGYAFDYGVYNSMDYGSVVNRRRLMLRAVKDGELPELPPRHKATQTWLDVIGGEAEVAKLPESTTGNAMSPNLEKRLKAIGIDPYDVKEPIIVMGGGKYEVRFARLNDPVPTPTASDHEQRILMPGGIVKIATPRIIARLMGLGDDFKLPEKKSLAYRVVGNGVPVQLTQAIFAPLLQKPDKPFSVYQTANGGAFDAESLKQAQLDLLKKENPMHDEYHTGIRTISDILTAEEAFKTKATEDDSFLYPDFTQKDGEEALKRGFVTVYSSHPIKVGTFVSPSRMQAQDYAGSGNVFSRVVPLTDVAWITSDEGEYAPVRTVYEDNSMYQESRGNTFGGAETPDDLDTETEATRKRIEDIEKRIAAGSTPMSRVERAFRESADLNEAETPGWVPREWIYGDDDKGDPKSRKNISSAIRRLAGKISFGSVVASRGKSEAMDLLRRDRSLFTKEGGVRFDGLDAVLREDGIPVESVQELYDILMSRPVEAVKVTEPVTEESLPWFLYYLSEGEFKRYIAQRKKAIYALLSEKTPINRKALADEYLLIQEVQDYYKALRKEQEETRKQRGDAYEDDLKNVNTDFNPDEFEKPKAHGPNLESIPTKEASERAAGIFKDDEMVSLKDADRVAWRRAQRESRLAYLAGKKEGFTQGRYAESQKSYSDNAEREAKHEAEIAALKMDNKLRLREEKNRSAERLARLKERVKALKEAQKRREATKRFVKQVLKRIERIRKSKNLSWNARQKIEEKLSGYTLKKLSKDKLARAEELAAYLRDNPDASEADFSKADQALLASWQSVRLNDMSIDNIRDLWLEIESLYSTGREEYEMWKAAKQQRRDDMFAECFEALGEIPSTAGRVIRSGDDLKKQYAPGIAGAAQKAKDWTYASTLGAQRLFDWIGGGNGQYNTAWSKWFMDRVNEAKDEEVKNSMARRAKVEEAMGRLGVTWYELSSPVSVDGQTYTVEEIMSIYALMKNEKGAKALLNGNFNGVFSNPEQHASRAIAQLTPQQRELADVILKDYDETFDRLNQRFIEAFNEGMVKEENYSPMRRLEYTSNVGLVDAEDRSVLEGAMVGAGKKASLEKGFTKRRIEIGAENQRAVDLGLVSIWSEQIVAQEHTAAFADIAGDLYSVLTKSKPGKDNMTLSKGIKLKYGNEAWKSVVRYVNLIIQNDAQIAHNAINSLSRRLAGNMSTVYLAGSLSTVLKQALSVPRVLMSAGPTHLFEAIAKGMASPQKVMDDVKKLDPQMADRAPNAFYRLAQIEPTAYSKLAYREKQVLDMLMAPISWMDRWAASVCWLATYDSNIARGLSHEASVREAQRAVALTQQTPQAKDMPSLWQQSGIAKLMMIFTTDSAQVWGMTVYDMAQALKRGEVPDILKTMAGITLSAVGLLMVTQGPPEDDDDESWIRWLGKALTIQTITAIPLIGKEIMAAYDELFNKKGNGNTYSAFSAPLVKLGRGFKDISSGGYTASGVSKIERGAWNVLEGLGLITGHLPVTMVKRLVKAAQSEDMQDALLTIMAVRRELKKAQ